MKEIAVNIFQAIKKYYFEILSVNLVYCHVLQGTVTSFCCMLNSLQKDN